MKLQKENITYITSAFNKMKSKADLLSLLNYVKVLLSEDKAYPFEVKQILYHCNPKANHKRYVQFSIKKKSGGERKINSPTAGLKSIQKCLNVVFQTIYNVNQAATGFVPGKSIVDNAKLHTGMQYVYNIDLKDFFPSIDAGRIWARLQYPPFNLKDRKEILNIITWLCCNEMEVERLDENNEWKKTKRSVLPQGAPTSPTLSNIVCQQLDFYLTAVAKRFGLKYSRYADDITFSSMHNVYQEDSDFLKEIHRIVSEQKFHIKESKTRLQKSGYRQEVTGLIVNENVNVQKRYIKELRMWLYYWETYGYEKASSCFLPHYIADKGYTKNGTPNLVSVVGGKLDYLKMVKGGDNKSYKLLRSRYVSCLNIDLKTKMNSDILLIKKSDNFENALRQKKFFAHNIIEKEKLIQNIDDYERALIKVSKIGRIFREKEKQLDSNIDKSVNVEPKEKHDPKRLTELLNKFTLDSSQIKYSTHPIEREEQFMGFDSFVSNFIEEELIEIKKYKLELWNLLIYPFLFQKDDIYFLSLFKDSSKEFGWGESKLSVGWKYKDRLKEMFENQKGLGVVKFPLSTKIDKQYLPSNRIDGKYLSTWNDYVEVFKNEIEFRYHNLEKIFESITAQLRTNFNNNIEIKGLAGLSFYTYTSKVKDALQLLISPFASYTNAEIPKILIEGEYDEIGKRVILRITNVDSYWDSIIDAENDKINLISGKGQLNSIKRLLYSLCDWSIESRFRIGNKYEYCRINYLYDKDLMKSNYYKPLIEREIKKVFGHTHVLTFYI